MDELDREPFLPKEQQEKFGRISLETSDNKRSKNFYVAAFVLQIVLIALYTIITIVVIKIQPNHSPIPSIQIDGLDIRYKNQVQSLADKTYKGLPTPEIDDAWDKLMAPMHIRVSAEELELSNQESVPLPGGGHLAWIGAFHQLHCVRLLRNLINVDYYAPGMSEENIYHLKSHGDHCLEMLRQSAMCGGDTSLTTFSWEPGKRRAGVNPVGYSLQTCVDWDALVSSLGPRVVGPEEYDSMENPFELN